MEKPCIVSHPCSQQCFNSYLCFLSLYTVLKMSRSGPGAVSMLLQIWSTLMKVPVLPTPALQWTSRGPPPVLWVLSRQWVSWTRVTRCPGSPPPGADLPSSVVRRLYMCTLRSPVRPVRQLEVDDHAAALLGAQPALARPGHVKLPHAVVGGLYMIQWSHISSKKKSCSITISSFDS